MKLYAAFIDNGGILSEPVVVTGFEAVKVSSPEIVGPHIREGIYMQITGMPTADNRKLTFEAALAELVIRGNIRGVVITVGD